MFNKKSKFNNVKTFQKNNNEILLIRDKFLEKFDSNLNILYKKNIDAPFGGLYNNYEHIFLWEQNKIFNIESNQYLSSKVDSCLCFSDKTLISIIYLKDYTQSQLCLYDFINENFVWKTDSIYNVNIYPFFCNGIKTIFYPRDNQRDLNAIEYSNGEPLWTLSVSEIGKYFHTFDKVWKEGQVWHFVGVVDGILWIDVMAKILIGVNVETGEIIYHFNKGINQKGEYEELPFYGKTTYDAKHHKLIGFYGDKYWEIDLSKKELKLRISNLKELLEKHEATLPNFDVSGITENHFFFGVGSMGGKRAQVLALNRNTFQIDWKYRFEGHALYFSPTKVDVTENHLFVLDNAGTLHIFEKAKV